MSRHIGQRSPRSPMATGVPMTPQNQAACQIFDQFCTANTFQAITSTFHQMCDLLELRPAEHRVFYRQLKHRLTSWKAQSLWTKLDKRAGHREYKKGTVSANARVLVIGCGPVGLRTAIEIAFCGGKTVVVEKRDRFSRNNVLHLWPFLIHDLKALGAKKFFGKFCAGAIDHISIRTLQCILLKVALLLGVEVHGGVGFDCLAEPHEEGTDSYAWRAKLDPLDHPVSEYEFDVLVGADGKRNTLAGFKRKEFRGKLAIAITANFINRNSQLEARVEEISGVAYIFNQKFFKDLNQKTGIDLENIVYYKDETHYFVMTAKKHSLLRKGVLRKDYDDPAKLLSRDNVDQEELMNYAREAADVSTNHLMPKLDFAHNHYGQPDVAMFDFTSMFAAEHASRVIEKSGKKILVCLVGDSLLEPFWPTGSGCARGFLSALDSAYMVRNWASGRMTPLEVMAERESIYQLLSQTTPVNLNKNFSQYTIDPLTRYPNINKQFFKPFQVRHQYEGVDQKQLDEIVKISELKSKRYEWIRDSHYLLKWFQRQLESYKNLVKIQDLTASWRNGLGLCALIHKYRPELVDVYSLDINKVAENNQKAFDIAEKQFGIEPVMTGQQMAQCEVPDKFTMASYLSRYYEYFRKESIRPAKMAKTPEGGLQVPRVANLSGRKSPSSSTRLAVLNKISQRIRQRRASTTTSGSEQGKRESRQSTDDETNQDDDMDKENESLKRHRKPGLSYGMARKKMKEEEESASVRFLENYRKLEGVGPGDDTRYNIVKKEIREAQVNAAVGVRGQNKVSELAKGLARQFSGGSQTPADPKKQVGKPARPLIMGHAVPAEMCYFCKDRVYLVERNTAEGLCFHRGCLKCDYCGTGLRIGGYAFQRTEEGEAKFYCLQHYGMRREFVRARKRSFSDKELLQKILPVISPEKAPLPGPAGAPRDSHLLKPPVSPISPPGDRIDGDKNKTPERIEFEPESEYEESELEQTTHNLSATLLDLSDEDQDSDSDSEDEECEWLDEEDLSDGDMSWAELARNYSKHMKKKLRSEARGADYDDSDSDTPTIGASDADYETDTETEDFQEVRMNRRTGRSNIPNLTLSPPKDYTPSSSPQKDAKSPASEEIQQKRNSFFSTVSEPVRIDPWSFLGISKKKPEEILKNIISKDQEQLNLEDSGDDADDIIDEEVIDVISLSEGELEQIEDELQESVNAEYSRLLARNNDDQRAKELVQEEVTIQQDPLQFDNSESPPSDDQFDMSEEELNQRRVERHQRMHQSDEVVSGVTEVKQLDVRMVSIEDGGSSDATSYMEEVVSPDKTRSLSAASLSQEMEAILEEMASLPQDMVLQEMVSSPGGDVEPADNTLTLDKSLSDCNIKSTEREPEAKTMNISDISSQIQESSVQDMEGQPDKEPEIVQKDLSQNKFDFFSSPSEPLRIDAKSFLGLRTELSRQAKDVSGESQGSKLDITEQLPENDAVLDLDKSLEKEANIKTDNKSKDVSELNKQTIDNMEDQLSMDILDSKAIIDEDKDVIEDKISETKSKSGKDSDSDIELATVDDLLKCGIIEELPILDVSDNKDPFDDTQMLVNENLAKMDNTQCEDISDIVHLNLREAASNDTLTQEEDVVVDDELKVTGLDSETELHTEDDLLKCGLIQHLPTAEDLKRIATESSDDDGLDDTEMLVNENLDEANHTLCEDLSDIVQTNLHELSSDDTILQDENIEEDVKITGLDPDIDIHTEDDLLKCGLIKVLPTKEDLDRIDKNECDFMEDTKLIGSKNLNETHTDKPVDLVSRNMTKNEADDTFTDKTFESDTQNLPMENSVEPIISNSQNKILDKHTDKSSSEESDTKFDTIKRKKSANKAAAKQVASAQSENSNETVMIDSNLETSESKNISLDLNSSSGNGNEQVKMSTSFYSEGNASRISSIPDSAPLANMDFEMEMTSGTDTDFEGSEPPKTATVEYVNIEDVIKQTHQNTESDLSVKEPTVLDKTLENETDVKMPSEIEKDAIKRIDEMLLSLEESKEMNDTPIGIGNNSDVEKTNTITKWLRDTSASILSPISKTENEKEQIDSSTSCQLKTDNDDSSLPYVSFTNDESSHFESFGTPNEGFIGSPAPYEEVLDNTPKRGTESEHVSKRINEADILDKDSRIVEQDELILSQSALDKLNLISDKSNLNDSSIIEYKVSDDEGEMSFCVDEKFVVTRDNRRKKKLKTSHSESSSDFTISTPSESLEFTSSLPELQSTQPSSVPLTASTTGDSFSAVKNVTSILNTEDNLSFSDIALTYERDSSVSLEKLLKNNVRKSAKELSSLDSNLEITLEQNNQELDSIDQDRCPSNLKSKSESPTLSKSIDIIDTESKSAPASVHPIKKVLDSQKSVSSCDINKGISSVSSPTNLSIGYSSISSSKEDTSFYYTPNVSEIEPMDTTEERNETPKSPAPTVKSDSMLLDDRRQQIRMLDNYTEPNQSPSSSNKIDAKRKFFCETPKPVRIDHFKLFERDSKMKGGGSPDGKIFQKGWKSLDTPPTTNITAAIPNSNLASGESEGIFYTPSTSVKSKAADEQKDDGFKKPQDVRRKLISDDSATNRSGMSVATELTSEERRQIFDEKRDQARTAAREKARLMSDEELGIKPSFTPKKEPSKPDNKESEKQASASGGSKAAVARPASARSYFSQSSKESTGAEQSPSSERKEKSKGLRVFKSQKTSPKMDKKQKKKKEDDEKENKDTEALKKEKKKSLLSMLRSSKSHEKKDKVGKSSSPMSPPLRTTTEKQTKQSTSSKETEKSEAKKHQGVIFRNKKSKSVEKTPPPEDPQAKRGSLYKELAPMFEQVLGGADGMQSVSAVKAKIEHVAPPPAKAPYTVLEPPKAAVEDFDTESEYGDTTSVRSFQGSSTVSGLTEEELAKLIKKQQKAAKRRQREQELRRLHMAQEIQRQLEEVEVKQREIEQKGVIIERALRGEGPDAKRDESELMQDWFNIVHEKNVLVRYESELMVHARELELEDRHARLEQQLRDRMSIDEDDLGSGGGGGAWFSSPKQKMEEEQRILQELVAVVEQRDALVALLEEDRQREREQEQGLKAIMSAKGFQLSPITYANRMRLPSLSDIHGTSSR